MFFPSSIVHSDQPHDITDFLVRTTTDLGCPLTPTNPDILIINQNHSIEQVRQISHFFGQKPILPSCQIVIIHQTDLFTAEAQNALLKTLEEPPEHAYFCLATTAPQKVPSTILSRCQQVRCEPLSDSDIAQALQDRNNVTQQEAILISAFAQGSYTRAVEFLGEAMQEMSRKKIQILTL